MNESTTDAIGAALREISEQDRDLLRTSTTVEERLLSEVRAISCARRAALLKTYATAAVLAVAVGSLVWLVSGRSSDTFLQQGPGSGPAGVDETTEFYPLFYSAVPASEVHIVRLEVSRAALASFGLDGGRARVDGPATVLADVIVGQDGLARAIRFVRDAPLEEQHR